MLREELQEQARRAFAARERKKSHEGDGGD
jgi:hypothetical protein